MSIEEDELFEPFAENNSAKETEELGNIEAGVAPLPHVVSLSTSPPQPIQPVVSIAPTEPTEATVTTSTTTPYKELKEIYTSVAEELFSETQNTSTEPLEPYKELKEIYTQESSVDVQKMSTTVTTKQQCQDAQVPTVPQKKQEGLLNELSESNSTPEPIEPKDEPQSQQKPLKRPPVVPSELITGRPKGAKNRTCMMSLDERLKVLTGIIKNKNTKTSDKIAAIKCITDLLNDKVEREGTNGHTTILKFEKMNMPKQRKKNKDRYSKIFRVRSNTMENLNNALENLTTEATEATEETEATEDDSTVE